MVETILAPSGVAPRNYRDLKRTLSLQETASKPLPERSLLEISATFVDFLSEEEHLRLSPNGVRLIPVVQNCSFNLLDAKTPDRKIGVELPPDETLAPGECAL